MIWITGYVGSGKTTISKSLKNVYEFDEIEDLMQKEKVDMSKITTENFKEECKKFLKKIKVEAFNGIQAVDYYQKGDKVYFVKTSFVESMRRCKKRDKKSKVKEDFKDNLKLFFRLKVLKLKCMMNKDVIKDIDELDKLIKNSFE